MMYQASVPVFRHYLARVAAMVEKAGPEALEAQVADAFPAGQQFATAAGFSLRIACPLAGRAVQLTRGTNSAEMDTLARVQFLQGKTVAAIATQEKAIAVEKRKEQQDDLAKTLAKYREGKLPGVGD